MSLHIAAIGTALPEHGIGQRDAAEIARRFCGHSPEQQRLLQALYRRAGVETRHSVLLERGDGPVESRQSF